MKVLQIVETKTSKVIKQLDLAGKSERAIEKLENGFNVNLDHQKFHTQILDQVSGITTAYSCADLLAFVKAHEQKEAEKIHYDLCSSALSPAGLKSTEDWDKVTCASCLQLKDKAPVRIERCKHNIVKTDCPQCR